METSQAMTTSAIMAVLTLMLLALATRPHPVVGHDVHSPVLGPPVSGFADPALSGRCEEMTVELAGDHRGPSTPAAAVAVFVASGEVPDELTVDDHRVLFEGEQVGTITTAEAPAGGYVVVSSEWCHP